MMKGETMTLTEISRYFHLNETIQKNREALKFLRERAEPARCTLTERYAPRIRRERQHREAGR